MPRVRKQTSHGTYSREPYPPNRTGALLQPLEPQSNASSTHPPRTHAPSIYSSPTHPLSAHPPPTQIPSTHPSPTSGRSPSAWTHEDDFQLIKARSEGQTWSPIASKYFPSKTPNACRKRHERLMEKRRSENMDDVKLDNLAKAYVESREEMWQVLAEKVGEKRAVVESKCLEVGLKGLQKTARTALHRDKIRSPSSFSDPLNDHWNDSDLDTEERSEELRYTKDSELDSEISFPLDGHYKVVQPDSPLPRYTLRPIPSTSAFLSASDNASSPTRKKRRGIVQDNRTQTTVTQPTVSDEIDELPNLCNSTDVVGAVTPGAYVKTHDYDYPDIQAEESILPNLSHHTRLSGSTSRIPNSIDDPPKLRRLSRTMHNSITISPSASDENSLQYEQSCIRYDDMGASDASRIPSGSTLRTDVTMSDQEILNDSDGPDLLSEEDLPDVELGNDFEQRMLDPKEYFLKLRDLEAGAVENSAIRHYKHYQDGTSTSESPPLSSVSYTDIFNPCITLDVSSSSSTNNTVLETCHQLEWQELFHLLECSNLSTRIYKNLHRLQDARFCDNTFSLLVKDLCRDRVVRLVSLRISDIHQLSQTFESSLSNVLRSVMPGPSKHDSSQPSEKFLSSTIYGIERSSQTRASASVPESYNCLLHAHTKVLTIHCRSILDILGLGNTTDNQPALIWRQVVHILDLVVVSYAGAHIEAFDKNYLGRKMEGFDVLGPFSGGLCSSPSQVVMRRRRLECLDEFLGKTEVWVFHSRTDDLNKQRLYLSTDVETLADLWGPLWKTVRSSEPGRIHEYNVGNGCIVPWNLGCDDKSLPSNLSVNSSEVFCHWISFRQRKPEDIEFHQRNLTKRYFDSTDSLLIGARPEIGLQVNRAYIPTLSRLAHLKTKFRERGALRHPRTQRSKRYKDSHAVQVQGSAMGLVSIADTITYKRRVGFSMKDALLERWRNGTRNPLELEAFSGVEISLCTLNARRRRLLQLLNSRTLRKYLKGISFVWDDEACETCYFKALQSPRAFRTFWREHRPWRKNVGDAVSECLDALMETGINEENRELSALWVETFDEIGDSDGEHDSDRDRPSVSSAAPSIRSSQESDFEAVEEWIVTLFRSEHTWTGFLQDSPECLTMAIMDTTCLDLDDADGYVRRCQSSRSSEDGRLVKWTPGYPVLQTSMLLNEQVLKNEGLEYQKHKNRGHKRYWDITRVKKNSRFTLGDHGSLTVYSSPRKDSPLIMEWDPVDNKTWQEVKNSDLNETILGKNVERHHQEYIRGAWDANPLPILILSRSTKTRFCKGR